METLKLGTENIHKAYLRIHKYELNYVYNWTNLIEIENFNNGTDKFLI